MAMCEGCKEAARTGDMSLHCGDRTCTCQHEPPTDPRVQHARERMQAQKLTDLSDTPSVDADLDDSPANHSRITDTPTPAHRERQTF